MKYNYDLIVIGGGSGGISSANLARNLGKKVALVEKNKIGGDCTWYGCVPSKALIKASEVAHYVMDLEKYGLRLNGPTRLDPGGVMAHIRAVRESVYQEETPEVFQKKGIDVFPGEPRFIDNHNLKVGKKSLSSNRFVIATGSSPFVPSIEGIREVPYLTNETIFELERLPASLAILGGGPIGSELASAFNRLGVRVVLIEMASQILPRDDSELVEILMNQMRKEGVFILTGTKATKLARYGEKIEITVQDSHGENKIEADSLLIAVGRRPNVNGLDLEKAGVAYSSMGIVTNEKLQTTASNIYACGDVIGSYQFSHIAEYHASIAVPNALLPLPKKRKVNYRNIVWATFTHPEFAHAGFSEREARQHYGDSLRIYKFDYNRVDRAKTDLNTLGISKFICDRKNKLLGIQILGERAAELLHEAQLAKTLGIAFHKIQKMIHIYPTYGDVVKRAAVAAYAEKLQNNFFIKLLRSIRK